MFNYNLIFFKKLIIRSSMKKPINIIYGNKSNANNLINTANSKFANNFLYQNYNKQSYNNSIQSSTIIKNKISNFSNSNLSNNQINKTDWKNDKNGSYSKSISSTLTNNVKIFYIKVLIKIILFCKFYFDLIE